MRPSHAPAGTPFRAAQRATALAPMISKRRSERSPILEVRPSRSLPPLERWTGVSPSQAAKSRPRRNVWAGGASAVRAAAVTAPMPGIVISRRATALSLACRAISRSSTATRSSNDRSSSTNTARIPRAAWGRSQAGSSMAAMSLEVWTGPLAAITPNSVKWPRSALMAWDGLGALANQQVPRAEHDGGGLLVRALEGHEAHGRALGGLADRLGIRHVVLLPLDEGLHVRRRDQLHRVAELGDLAPPVVGAATGLHGHRAGRQRGQERKQLAAA